MDHTPKFSWVALAFTTFVAGAGACSDPMQTFKFDATADGPRDGAAGSSPGDGSSSDGAGGAGGGAGTDGAAGTGSAGTSGTAGTSGVSDGGGQ
jgi:hypothetical protein